MSLEHHHMMPDVTTWCPNDVMLFLARMYVHVPGMLSRYPHSEQDTEVDTLIHPLSSGKLWAQVCTMTYLYVTDMKFGLRRRQWGSGVAIVTGDSGSDAGRCTN